MLSVAVHQLLHQWMLLMWYCLNLLGVLYSVLCVPEYPNFVCKIDVSLSMHMDKRGVLHAS